MNWQLWVSFGAWCVFALLSGAELWLCITEKDSRFRINCAAVMTVIIIVQAVLTLWGGLAR